MKKSLALLKNYKISIPVALVLIVIGGVAFAFRNNTPKQEFVTASRGSVVQEVDVTGRVVPATQVDLAVESGGRVSAIPVKVGQNAYQGQVLLRVDSSDLQIRLSRQQAALDKARIELAKVQPKTTAADDLTQAYEDGFNAVADTFLDVPSIVTGVEDVLAEDYLAENSIRITDGRRALDMRRDVEDSFYEARKEYNTVLKQYRSTTRESSKEDIESLIVNTYAMTKTVADAVKKTNNLVDYMEDQINGSMPSELAGNQTSLDEYTAQTNTHLSKLLTLTNTIKDAHQGVTDENLDLTSTQINVHQAELDVADTLNQISKRSIRAPLSGVVTDISTEVGETVSSGNPIVSMISSSKYEVEVNLPEADVSKVKVGAQADIVLDAYGSDVVFEATVVSVNPAEKIIDGVATYKTTLQFVTSDNRIKSGMTADITIKGERKDNVITVPQRAVITKDGGKIVRILVGEEIIEKPVKTGLRGSDGSVEITDGIKEGDKVIVYLEGK